MFFWWRKWRPSRTCLAHRLITLSRGACIFFLNLKRSLSESKSNLLSNTSSSNKFRYQNQLFFTLKLLTRPHLVVNDSKDVFVLLIFYLTKALFIFTFRILWLVPVLSLKNDLPNRLLKLLFPKCRVWFLESVTRPRDFTTWFTVEPFVNCAVLWFRDHVIMPGKLTAINRILNLIVLISIVKKGNWRRRRVFGRTLHSRGRRRIIRSWEQKTSWLFIWFVTIAVLIVELHSYLYAQVLFSFGLKCWNFADKWKWDDLFLVPKLH